MKKENLEALSYMSEKLGVTRGSVINLALFEFAKKNFPEIILEGDFSVYKETLQRLEE